MTRTDQLRTQMSSSGADRTLAIVDPMPTKPSTTATTGVVTAVNTSVLCQGKRKTINCSQVK